jgi:HPt (histidine-containing phosphotransfer) domain-containing protein
MQRDKDASLKAGMDGHISKPIDEDQLGTTLRRFLAPQSNSMIVVSKKNLAQQKYADFSYESLREHFSNNTILMEKVLNAFVYDLQKMRIELEKALENSDKDRLLSLAHNLKGIAGNLQAIGLYEEAKVYESALKSSQAYETEKIIALLNETLTKAEEYVKQQEPHISASKEININELNILLSQIAVALKNHRLVNDTLMEDLYNSGTEAKLYKQIKQQIDAFDYINAKKSLDTIASKYGAHYDA